MKVPQRSSILLLTIILMDLLVGMEFDLFVPSFPLLQSQFHLSPSLVEALLSVNFLGYCLSLFFVGVLADRYGRKPILLLGFSTFIVGSLLCLWATSYPFLIIGRFLQGVGVSAPSILSFLIIADAYSLQKQQYYMSMLNGVMNTAVAVSPVIGSYITLYFSWQGNFITLLLLGLIASGMTLLFVPKNQAAQPKPLAWFSGYAVLFKSKSLVLLMMNIILMFLPYWIFVGMSPLLYMKDLNVSLAHFGYYQGVLALVFALGSFLFGLVMHRFQNKRMLLAASVLYLISLMSLLVVTFWHGASALAITLAFLPFIISQIIPSNLLGPLCLNLIPEAKAKVSAVLQGSRLVFAAISLQCAGYFYQGSFQNIGIMLSVLILMIMLTHHLVIKNHEIRSALSQK